MTNTELRELIRDKVCDEETLDNILLLEGDEFADGAIGITEDNRVVYSYSRLVESLSEAYNLEGSKEERELQASEWLNYNTLRAIPYMNKGGQLAPLVIFEFEE